MNPFFVMLLFIFADSFLSLLFMLFFVFLGLSTYFVLLSSFLFCLVQFILCSLEKKLCFIDPIPQLSIRTLEITSLQIVLCKLSRVEKFKMTLCRAMIPIPRVQCVWLADLFSFRTQLGHCLNGEWLLFPGKRCSSQLSSQASQLPTT